MKKLITIAAILLALVTIPAFAATDNDLIGKTFWMTWTGPWGPVLTEVQMKSLTERTAEIRYAFHPEGTKAEGCLMPGDVTTGAQVERDADGITLSWTRGTGMGIFSLRLNADGSVEGEILMNLVGEPTPLASLQ